MVLITVVLTWLIPLQAFILFAAFIATEQIHAADARVPGLDNCRKAA